MAGAEVLVQQPAKTFPNRLSINAMVKQYQLGQVDTWSWCWWWSNHLVAGAQMLVQAASHLLVLVQLFGGWCCHLVPGAQVPGAASKSFAGLTNRRCQGRTLLLRSLELAHFEIQADFIV